MDLFTKQPADILDYGVNLSKWLSSGDTISSSTAFSAPAGLTLSVTNNATSEPKIWVSGGTDGVEYKITLTAVTTGGRTKEFDFMILVSEI